MNVAVDPNILKNIEIRITVVGEATGKVLLDKGKGRERTWKNYCQFL